MIRDPPPFSRGLLARALRREPPGKPRKNSRSGSACAGSSSANCFRSQTGRPLFSNISPKKSSSISASAGPGFGYGYGVTQHDSQVRLWIKPGETQEENDAALNALRKYQEEIASKLKVPVEWVQDDYQRRLVAAKIDGGYRDSDQWERVHRELARAMVAFESVFDPHLDEARQAAAQVSTEVREAGERQDSEEMQQAVNPG